MHSGRSSFTVMLARKVQLAPLWLFRFVEWPFVALFRKKVKGTPAIFVLALPRSGSTVTYQSICHGLEVNYLSNLWSLLYQLPFLGGRLSARRALSHRSDFTSEHGFVAGLDGPAEGLKFWQWWLDCGLSDADCASLPTAKLAKRTSYLRDVFSALACTGQPFATSYLGHTLVPERVQRAFPGAVFIRLKREPVSNALSLLKSMRKGDSDWFSVRPRECDVLQTETEYERVAAQVYWLNRRLDDDSCSDSQMLTIHYEDLCENPEREIERVRNWCCEMGVPVARKFNLPETFPFKKADLKADPEAIAIRAVLDRLEARYGKLEEGE